MTHTQATEPGQPVARHTPEPWYYDRAAGGNQILARDNGNCLVLRATAHGATPEEIEANASRIVACVNACAGIDPAAIKGLLAKPVCMWNVDDDGVYSTACGNSWLFTDGGPGENKAAFCVFCGRAITEADDNEVRE